MLMSFKIVKYWLKYVFFVTNLCATPSLLKIKSPYWCEAI